MKKYFEKWKKKSLLSKISDFIFLSLIVMLIVPGTRTGLMSVFSNVKSKIVQPKITSDTSTNLIEKENFNWILTDMNGDEVNFQEFYGKIIFINFWATWCGPCIGEKPEIQKFFDKYKDDENIVFVIASNEDLDVLRNFIETRNYTFPVYSIKTKTPDFLNYRSLPTSFLINKKGIVMLRNVGPANWSGERMDNIISNLLL